MITDGDLHHLLLFCLASPYFSRGWYSENSCLYKNSVLTIMINCYFCFVVELDFPLCLRRQPQPQSIFSSLKFFCRNKKRTVFFLIIGSVCFGQPVCYCELSQMTCNVIRYFSVLLIGRTIRDITWWVRLAVIDFHYVAGECPLAQALKSGRKKRREQTFKN